MVRVAIRISESTVHGVDFVGLLPGPPFRTTGCRGPLPRSVNVVESIAGWLVEGTHSQALELRSAE